MQERRLPLGIQDFEELRKGKLSLRGQDRYGVGCG